nr:MAG TPA: DNA repair protein REV1 [Caudoviricetes sp.]
MAGNYLELSLKPLMNPPSLLGFFHISAKPLLDVFCRTPLPFP